MSEPMNNPYQVTRADVDDVGPAVDRGEKPTTVSVAVVMLWLALIIQLAGLVWTWQFFRWGPPAIQVMLVVVSLIWLFLAYLVAMIEKGLNWARITFLVLYVLGLLFSALSIEQALEQSPLAATSAIAQSVLQAIAMVLVFLRPSNPWYRGVRS
jgi:hypothetical protein